MASFDPLYRALVLSTLGLLGGAACSSAAPDTKGGGASPTDPTNVGEGAADKDPDDPANQPPHALGTITLGESHLAEGGTSYPFVSAVFVPDARAAQACKQKIAGCEVIAVPKCGANGCDDGEVCAFDTSCAPSCKKIAVCSKDCDEDEFCSLDKAGKATCSKMESFDAGPIAFGGTTTSITLFPPYTYEGNGQGAPFLPGAEIKVKAQGATGAGFEAFDETFTATTLIQPKPALTKLSREEIFGTGALPISWVPGNDTIVITLGGVGGSVTCKAKDTAGTFDVPRAAINAALGEGEGGGTATLSLSIARQRTETKKGKKAQGELSSADVQSEGWLNLVTMSSETMSAQGCSSDATMCGDSCVDTMTDNENCGGCGKACGAGSSCSEGKCAAGSTDPTPLPNACAEKTKTTTCKTQWSACTADPKCVSLYNCMTKCTTNDCFTACYTSFPTGGSKFQTFFTCASGACAP